jgi:hypothetical protein
MKFLQLIDWFGTFQDYLDNKMKVKQKKCIGNQPNYNSSFLILRLEENEGKKTILTRFCRISQANFRTEKETWIIPCHITK